SDSIGTEKALGLLAATAGLALLGGRCGLRCFGAAHGAPGIGRGLGVGNLPQGILIGFILDRILLLLLRRFGLELRHQVDIGGLRVGRHRQQYHHRGRAQHSHDALLWDADLAFSPGYHRPNRLAKRDGPSLWFDARRSEERRVGKEWRSRWL